MIEEGYPISVIRVELSKKFNVAEGTIENQYYSLLSEISLMVSDNKEALRAKLMARNEAIYHKSVTERKYKVALEANLAQARLGGLLDKQETEKKLPEIIEVTERPPLKIVGDDGSGE